MKLWLYYVFQRSRDLVSGNRLKGSGITNDIINYGREIWFGSGGIRTLGHLHSGGQATCSEMGERHIDFDIEDFLRNKYYFRLTILALGFVLETGPNVILRGPRQNMSTQTVKTACGSSPCPVHK